MEINKFKNKYRIKSVRMDGFDYCLDGSYFITVCVKDRKYLFGDVIGGQMQLGELGKIAEKYWIEVSRHYPFVSLGEFVVMPNHVHGIINIDRTWERIKEQREALENKISNSSCCEEISDPRRDKAMTDRCRDEALPRLYRGEHSRMSEISPKPGSLSVIVGSYKSAVCKRIHQIRPEMDFQWQARFYDRIIRNEVEYEKLKRYIWGNPEKWEIEKNNLENLYF